MVSAEAARFGSGLCLDLHGSLLGWLVGPFGPMAQKDYPVTIRSNRVERQAIDYRWNFDGVIKKKGRRAEPPKERLTLDVQA